MYLYWSGHGSKKDDICQLEGKEWFGVFMAMEAERWLTSDNLLVVTLAACHCLNSTFAKNWANSMRKTNMRIVTGYRDLGPAGNNDTVVAKGFFSSLKNGNSIRVAWEAGNKSINSYWTVISYGGTSGNKNMTLPGFGTNSGTTRDASIYYIYSGSTGTIINAANSATAEELPYEVRVSPEVVGLNVSDYGHMHFVQDAHYVDAMLRANDDKDTDEATLKAHIAKAIAEIGATAHVEGIDAEFVPTISQLIGETELGPKVIVGGDLVFSKKINGIPVKDNNLIVCADADGVYRVINQLKSVESVPTQMIKTAALVEKNNASLGLEPGVYVETTEHAYIESSDGVYKLCTVYRLSDKTVRNIDCVTGEEL